MSNHGNASRRVLIKFAAVVALAAALFAGTVPTTFGLGERRQCQVNNVVQGTVGDSLRKMAAAAYDGDALQVQSTCKGGVVVAVDLSIRGYAGIVDGGETTRGVEIRAGATVSLEGLAITRGSGLDGAGVLNNGTLTMSRSTVDDNAGRAITNTGTMTLVDMSVRRNVGGGISNSGTLAMVGSLVAANEAGSAAGIYNSPAGSLVITRSTVARNLASNASDNSAGGILNWGNLMVADSTVSQNMARSYQGYAYGGGISNLGVAVFTNSTVSGNTVLGQNSGFGGGIANGGLERGGNLILIASTVTANHSGERYFPGYGGGLWNPRGSSSATIRSSIIAGNTVTGYGESSDPDCSGTFTSLGRNLIGIRRGCHGFAWITERDLVGSVAHRIDPKLGPLSDNGGPTRTHTLLPGSPAANADPSIPCATLTDQRGVRRPQGRKCDIGAVERIPIHPMRQVISSGL